MGVFIMRTILENLWVVWISICLQSLQIGTINFWITTIPLIILVALSKTIQKGNQWKFL